jgi:hypothetical protein
VVALVFSHSTGARRTKNAQRHRQLSLGHGRRITG